MYAGQKWFDQNAAFGVKMARRNPKRKNRLPYHSKNHLALPVLASKTCYHSLARHEELVNTAGKHVTASYALACQVKHKPTTKNPVHKDTLGRKW